MVSPRRALLSVSDKEGLVEFARGLRDLGFELIGTDGTAKTLKEAGLPVTTVADYTGLREGLGGRARTPPPRPLAGTAAPRRARTEHAHDAQTDGRRALRSSAIRR